MNIPIHYRCVAIRSFPIDTTRKDTKQNNSWIKVGLYHFDWDRKSIPSTRSPIDFNHLFMYSTRNIPTEKAHTFAIAFCAMVNNQYSIRSTDINWSHTANGKKCANSHWIVVVRVSYCLHRKYLIFPCMPVRDVSYHFIANSSSILSLHQQSAIFECSAWCKYIVKHDIAVAQESIT